MIQWNYPDQVLIKLRSKSIWKNSILNFIALNIVYFFHNLTENRGENILEKTIYDQLFLLLYYLLVILLISMVVRLFKLQYSLSLITQYLLSTSIILSTVYILDIPVLLFGYNIDIFFTLLELLIYLWISWTLVRGMTKSTKKYVVIASMMCVFYLTSVLRIIILGISNILRSFV